MIGVCVMDMLYLFIIVFHFQVCLSILNTWHGSPEEKWNAQTSSFLQAGTLLCVVLVDVHINSKEHVAIYTSGYNAIC